MVAVLLAAVLALMARPGTTTRATLTGVELVDVVPVDRVAFSAESATIHLLTQPVSPGVQTLVVHITDGDGRALVLDPAPTVEVSWTPFSKIKNKNVNLQIVQPQLETTVLDPATSGAFFIGTAMSPASGWWQADVSVTPANGIASRARYWCCSRSQCHRLGVPTRPLIRRRERSSSAVWIRSPASARSAIRSASTTVEVPSIAHRPRSARPMPNGLPPMLTDH